MRRIFGIAFLALFLLALFPLALAEGSEVEMEDDTLEEISSMGKGIGAEVRLLQLEKSIARNILVGETVVAYVEEKGGDTTELESLLNDMEALKLEVESLDPAADDAVEAFVNIKQESIEISKEFREKSKDLISEEDRAGLLEKIKAIDTEDLKEYNAEIKNKIRTFNAENTLKVFETLGITDAELIAKIESGEATREEVKEAIKTALEAKTPEQRKEAKDALKDADLKKNVAAKERVEKARLKVNERKAEKQEWLSKASEKIADADRKARVQATLDKRAEIIDDRINRINTRLEKIEKIKAEKQSSDDSADSEDE